VNTLVQTLLITAFAFLLVRWTFASPLAKMAKWLRTLRAGSPSETPPTLPQGEIFDQLHNEVRHLAHDLTSARAAAREEAQLRETQSSLWTPDRLRVSLESKLHGDALFVVSNREPYMHVFNEGDNAIRVIVPASGLVTARSGTTLRALNAELSDLGLAMANLGDIDAQTLAGALCTVLNAVTGFTNKSLRELVSAFLGADYTRGQMSYDLRRLRLHGLIQRLPHSNTYHLTPEGIRVAVFYTKLQNRLLRPLLDADQPPASVEVRHALKTLETAVLGYIHEVRLAPQT